MDKSIIVTTIICGTVALAVTLNFAKWLIQRHDSAALALGKHIIDKAAETVQPTAEG